MDKKSVEEMEARFRELVQQPPYPVAEMVELIRGVSAGKGEMMAVALLHALGEAADFEGVVALLSSCSDLLSAHVSGIGVRDVLRKTTKDRLLLSFVGSIDFEHRALKDSIARLTRLMSFKVGTLVFSSSWGLGEVKALDDFYRRVTVAFRGRPGHQLTYDAACETLAPAPADHILVQQKNDPARIAKLLQDQPADFVVEMLKSFGKVPVTRLEELCEQYGFVKKDAWKKFWEGARAGLRQNKLVEIPTRRADPILLKTVVENYGDAWFSAFEQIREPKLILSSVRELAETGEYAKLEGERLEAARAKIAARLAFALKGARKVDDALYARIAMCLSDLKLDAATVDEARAYLWEDDRYLAAARTLPARDTGALVRFLVADDRENRKRALFEKLPQFCFPFLAATLDEFRADADCEAAVAALLNQPAAPATLVTLVLGRYNEVRKVKSAEGKNVTAEQGFKAWTKIPKLVVLLMHAIALGEGRQGGETLRMQNVIRRLFVDQKWLEGIFAQLEFADQALVFERFQASITWDPATHHMIVVRMTKIVPELVSRLTKKVEAKKIERITSLRSYAERQAAYERLVKVEIPANTKRIEFAKSYGDLSENAEYQYAKDEQRALMQKESLLQKDLNEVKAVSFEDVKEPAHVCPGSTVVIATADGRELVYTVLGEWDNDLSRNIISNKTKLAQNMLEKKVGETFELLDSQGGASVATIKAIQVLSDEVRAWIQEVPAAV